MSRGPGAQHRLSDLQSCIIANLREQSKLRSELSRLHRLMTPGQKSILAPRIKQLRTDLLALDFAMSLHRRQEKARA
jgi:hypothetical protein